MAALDMPADVCHPSNICMCAPLVVRNTPYSVRSHVVGKRWERGRIALCIALRVQSGMQGWGAWNTFNPW